MGFDPQGGLVYDRRRCRGCRQEVRKMVIDCLHFLVGHVVDKICRYPLLIDAVIQSSGVGLIGTAESTMSLLAGRRVQDWNNGVYEEVKWGTPNADNH